MGTRVGVVGVAEVQVRVVMFLENHFVGFHSAGSV